MLIKEPPKPTSNSGRLVWYGFIAILASAGITMCGKPSVRQPVKKPDFVHQVDAGR
jgi:hypothetical protein